MNQSLEQYLEQLNDTELQTAGRELGCTAAKSKPRSYMISLILKQAAEIGLENINWSKLGRTGVDCICGKERADRLKICSKCGEKQHLGCIKAISALQPYECPKCQIEQIDPFAPVTQFLCLPTLVRFFSAHRPPVSFQLPPESKGNKDSIRIQIRCLRLDPYGYQHFWPDEAGIIVDSKREISLSPSKWKKRRDYPMDLSLDMSKETHTVAVVKRADLKEYAYAVVIVGRRQIMDLVCLTLAGKVMSFQEGKENVAAAFGYNGDLQMEYWRLSLRCPLTHTLLETPVRGWKCTHIQCFSLKVFLTLQSDSTANKWLCPLCKANCSHLVVDQYLETLVKEAARLGNCDTVEFRSDGCYRLIQDCCETGSGSLLQSVITENEGYVPAIMRNSSVEISSEHEAATPPNPFDWSQFLAGLVSVDSLYASAAYKRAAEVEAPRMHMLLTRPQEKRTARVSLGSVSTVHRASIGSSLKPICLD